MTERVTPAPPAGGPPAEVIPGTATEWHQALTPAPETMLELVAGAYRDASLADADMRRAVASLEGLRDVVGSGADAFAALDEIDSMVGEAVGAPLQGVFSRLREAYQSEAYNSAIAIVRAAFARGSAAGWRAWLRAYASGLAGPARESLSIALADAEFPFGPDVAETASWLVGMTRYLRLRRWGEFEPAVRFCVDNAPLTRAERAKLLVAQAQISRYQLLDNDEARVLLERAEAECPDEPAVGEAWGSYLLAVGQLDLAKSWLDRSLEADPTGMVCTTLGDYYAQLGEPDSAMHWYTEATVRAPHVSAGYRSLMLSLGAPAEFEENQRQVEYLARQAIAVAPLAANETSLELAGVYRDSGRLDLAEAECTRLIDAAPDMIGAYGVLGDVYFKRGDLLKARETYASAITVAPDLYDGYWNIATLCQRTGQEEEAIEWFDQAANREPRLLPPVLAQVTQVLIGLGRAEEAGERLLRALEARAQDETLLGALSLVTRSMAPGETIGRAIGLLERVRQLQGPEFEAEFHNRVGHLWWYRSDFDSASKEYRRAAELAPSDAVFRRNLAGALRNMGKWETARDELQLSREVDGDEGTYRHELALTFNEEAASRLEEQDYEAAFDGYLKAVQLEPTERIYQSNLANAWEQLDDPDTMLRVLQAAEAVLKTALAIKTEGGDGGMILGRLEQARGWAEHYGPEILRIGYVLPIAVAFADDLVPRVDSAQDGGQFLYTDIPAMRDRILARLGFRVTGIRLRPDPGLDPGHYVILMGEVQAARGVARPGRICVEGGTEQLAKLRLETDASEVMVSPISGGPCVWVSAELAPELDRQGISWRGDTGTILAHLQDVLEREATLLFGVEEAGALLEDWGQDPVRRVQIDRLAHDEDNKRLALGRVLRTLLGEGVRLTEPNLILNALEDVDLGLALLPDDIQRVRHRLRPLLPGNQEGINQVRLPASIERDLSGALALSPAEETRIVGEILDLLPGWDVALVTRSYDVALRIRALLDGLVRMRGGTLSLDEVVDPQSVASARGPRSTMAAPFPAADAPSGTREQMPGIS